jgi:hypothetical protein
MLSPTTFITRTHLPVRQTARLIVLITLGSISLFQASAKASQAGSFALFGDPNFSFGSSAPNVSTMAMAIQFRMGIPVSVVTNLPDENTAFGPVLADTEFPPNYVYGPSFGGVIKNLNLNAPVVTGLTSGSLRTAGFETDFCGDIVERYVLRLFSADQFFDVLVRFATCSGTSNVLWSFDQVSSPRPIANPTPTPAPTPFPVQLVSTVSRQIHGLAGPFDINLPLAGPPGIECRQTTGNRGSYMIIYTFSRPLNSVYSATVTSGEGHVHDSSIGVDPHQYIVNLVNVTNAQSIVVTLNYVQDSRGHVSNVVNANMSILIADVGANRNVGKGDVRKVKSQLGQPVTMLNFRDDVNHDGVIDSTDLRIVRNHRGASLPP